MRSLFFYIIGSSSTTPIPVNDASDRAEKTTSKQGEPAEKAIPVTATELIVAYKSNEVSADATYKGKLISVSGTVGSIAKDIMDSPYITLIDESAYSFVSVQCVFSKSQESELVNVSKDQSITLQGRVSGKMGNVIVRECTILK